MSYDIKLVDPKTKKTIEFENKHQIYGGTHALGGTNEAWLNITYNYAPHYRKAFDGDRELTAYEKMFGEGDTGVRKIYGLTAKESLPATATQYGMGIN